MNLRKQVAAVDPAEHEGIDWAAVNRALANAETDPNFGKHRNERIEALFRRASAGDLDALASLDQLARLPAHGLTSGEKERFFVIKGGRIDPAR